MELIIILTSEGSTNINFFELFDMDLNLTLDPEFCT